MPNYCSNCGKKLIDGKTCDCAPEEDMQQQSYECPYQQKGIQAAGVNPGWIHGRKQQLAEQVKKITGEIPDLIKQPDAAINRNVTSASYTTVLLMIAFKTAVLSVILCFTVSYIKSRTNLLPDISIHRLILGLAAAVFGSACLQAGIFRGTVYLFKGQTTFQKMLSAIGISSLIDGLGFAAGALLMLIIPRLGVIVALAGIVLRGLFYLNGYGHGVELPQNKKLYCFAAARVCYITAVCIIIYAAVPLAANSSVSGLLNDLFAGLG